MRGMEAVWALCRAFDAQANQGLPPARRGRCAECGREAFGDEFALSQLCQPCLNPQLAAQLGRA